MLFRFSLYGFLKNQRYFEAFLVLAFLEKGLDFFQIGLLIAVRELTVNVLEIPSGAMADVWGRRLVMICSFASYIGSFLVLGLAGSLAVLAGGMVLYGVGDAFRTGTHKAMIFAWLEAEGRQHDRVKVYGYTRSWSKFGSAVSAVIATAIVLGFDRYADIFFVSIVPYAIGIINFIGYPKTLDGARQATATPRAVVGHMVEAARVAVGRRGVRRLVLESMGFDGVFGAVKDYLQPVLAATAIAIAGGLVVESNLTATRSTALLVGPVYFLLHVLSGLSSRQAHRLSSRAGDDDRAAGLLWTATALLFGGLAVAGYLDVLTALIAGFVVLHVLHNLWRPVLISRFDHHGGDTPRASLLSIESQATRASTMIIAPGLGLAVDAVAANGPGGAFWPIGALGLVVCTTFVGSTVVRRRRAC